MSQVVLVLNCGSSSVKYALYDPVTQERLVVGLAEKVGTPDARITSRYPEEKRTIEGIERTDHTGVLARILNGLDGWLSHNRHRIIGVGHRIVHGGERFQASVVLDDETLAAIEACVPLAPLHNPANITGVRAALEALPDVPQIGVFDTAFHQTMPPHSYRYAVPRDWYTDLGVRRYGFHGTSHRFVSQAAADYLNTPIEELRIVTAHLGNGASLAAIVDGVSVDTSMGLTPLEGVVMGTRSGDIDPGLPGYVHAQTGKDVDQIVSDLNKRSGLLGLSGISNDMREVHAAAERGDGDARLALDVFQYRLAKYIASLTVATQGLDVLVFTGGIGENDAQTRAGVMGQLRHLGIELDARANAELERGRIGTISTGAVTVLVIPTDEELVIARDTYHLATGHDFEENQR